MFHFLNIFCLFGQFVAKNAKHFIVAHTVDEITFFNDFFKKKFTYRLLSNCIIVNNQLICKQKADLKCKLLFFVIVTVVGTMSEPSIARNANVCILLLPRMRMILFVPQTTLFIVVIPFGIFGLY